MSPESGLIVDEPATQEEVLSETALPTTIEAGLATESPSRLTSIGKRGLSDLLPPILGIAGFLLLWAIIAPRIDTRVGSLPGPVEVFDAGRGLYEEWQARGVAEAAFLEAQDVQNAEFIAAGTPELVRDFAFPAPPSFPQQIWTSLQTCLLYTSPSPRDQRGSRMPSSA